MHDSEERLRLLTEGTRESAIYMLDPDGRITSWNEGGQWIKGYGADEIIGRHFSIFYTSQDIAGGKPVQALEVAQKEGRFEDEALHVRKDGSFFWASVVISPLFSKNGALNGYLKITRDVSRRRRAQQDLAEGRARLEGVVASAMDAIITVDAEHRIVMFNRSAELMFGRSIAEVIGQTVDLLLPERFREHHSQHIRTFGETKVSNRTMGRLCEISGLRANGEEFPIEASISQAEVSGSKLFTIILRDVTERKRIESELKDANERMRLALEASNAGAWAWDIAKDVVTDDGAYRALYGFDGGEPIDSAAWEARVHPDDRNTLRNKVASGATNDGEWREEFRIRHPVLGERWLAGRGKVLFGPEGKAVGMTGINLDVTERKQAEEHMRFVMRELSHRTKNLLAVVQAIAWQSANTARDIGEFQERLTSRIDALRRSHDLLVKRAWVGVELTDLVRSQLAPFLDDAEQRLSVRGCEVTVKPSGAEDLGLVLHELATNASKYGALSVPGGHVAVEWRITPAVDGTPTAYMVWREHGGPAVVAPAQTGFGSKVIKDMLATTKQARTTLEFPASGLVWTMEVVAECMFDGETDVGQPREAAPVAD